MVVPSVITTLSHPFLPSTPSLSLTQYVPKHLVTSQKPKMKFPLPFGKTPTPFNTKVSTVVFIECGVYQKTLH